MKKILSFVFAALLMVGVATEVFAQPGYRQDPGIGDILGQSGYQNSPDKFFRMVRYVPVTADSPALAADSIVIWDLTEDDGITVTTTTTSRDSAVAGIIVTQALTQDTDGNTAAQDVGKDNWTWLQTYGLSQVNVALTIITAGDAMGTSTTAGEANTFISGSTNPRLQGNAGFFYDTAAAGDDDVQCFLTGLD